MSKVDLARSHWFSFFFFWNLFWFFGYLKLNQFKLILVYEPIFLGWIGSVQFIRIGLVCRDYLKVSRLIGQKTDGSHSSGLTKTLFVGKWVPIRFAWHLLLWSNSSKRLNKLWLPTRNGYRQWTNVSLIPFDHLLIFISS